MYIVFAVLISAADNVIALDLPEPPFGKEIETRMIDHHTIHIAVTGCVTGQFNKAIHVLNSSNILEKIQIAYAARLPEGEFKVEAALEGHYYYVNKHKERADVHVYPHCMALRIFLKYFPGVKRYFRNKTAEMQGIITGVFNHMIAA